MLMSQRGLELLEEQEGYRRYVYDDETGRPITAGSYVEGNPTIGFGHLLTSQNGVTMKQAEMLLQDDLESKEQRLTHLACWDKLNQERKDVLINMAFNMGINGLLGFHNMFAAIMREDWKEASSQMRESEWADEVGERATELANIMETGMYP